MLKVNIFETGMASALPAWLWPTNVVFSKLNWVSLINRMDIDWMRNEMPDCCIVKLVCHLSVHINWLWAALFQPSPLQSSIATVHGSLMYKAMELL